MRSNLQIVSDHYAASDRGDIAGMMADVAPDAQWTEMAGFPCAGTWTGPDQIVEHVFKVLGSEWIDYRMSLESLIDAGECIVGIGAYSGTYRRTGKAMQARVAHVWQLADGKIVRFEQFTDTLLVARAMQDTRSG
jgi:ketosteroid isomerase-like protein